MDRWKRWRDTWRFFAEFPHASRGLAAAWWALVVSLGVLPALFAVATGDLVAAAQRGTGLPAALALAGSLFVAMQAIAPLQGAVSTSLGERLTARLSDRILAAAIEPEGLGHLEDPGLADDLAAARDLELDLTGPSMALALETAAPGFAAFVAGLAQAVILVGYRWWAGPLIAAGWVSTRLLLRTVTPWDLGTGDVLAAQRRADHSYRLAVDPAPAKEIRLFGLPEWAVARFADARRQLVDARWAAARLPRHRVAAACVLVVGANVVVLVFLARDAASGALALGAAVTFAQAAVGASGLGLGGSSWALPYVVADASNMRQLEPRLRERGALPGRAVPAQTRGPAQAEEAAPADGLPVREIRFRDVSFSYSAAAPPVLDGLNLTIPAGSSMAVVGLNGAGKTTLVKLLCRLYDPTAGRVEADGTDLRELAPGSWRRRLSVIFQDYVRYDLSLRDNVAPLGAPDDDITEALAQAGVSHVASLDTVLAAGYPGGRELSGGQWQRVALARVLHGLRTGAGVVILDEPTAQLDVRGEAETFERLLEATRGRTTILISHRFSTVRRADRICVLERGRVAETGTHDELMAAGGRYQTLFGLQASRFEEPGEEESGEPVLA
jgi:ABC-type transport system involved in cytochrome bd biosynthesis fused ATPase/permease subunit